MASHTSLELEHSAWACTSDALRCLSCELVVMGAWVLQLTRSTTSITTNHTLAVQLQRYAASMAHVGLHTRQNCALTCAHSTVVMCTLSGHARVRIICSPHRTRALCCSCRYFVGRNPLMYTVDADALLHPTLYLLHAAPQLLKRVTIHPGVGDKIKGGAELFMPGEHVAE